MTDIAWFLLSMGALFVGVTFAYFLVAVAVSLIKALLVRMYNKAALTKIFK
jgi:hypothetical protein